jgi:hypothetical protein
MSGTRAILWLIPLAALGLFAAFGCGGDDDDDNDPGDDADDTGDDDGPHFDNPIDEGRYWLRAGNPQRARLAFARAIEMYPEEPDARSGAMLSADLHLMSILSLVSVYLGTIDNGYDAKGSDPTRDMLRQIVLALTDDAIGPAAREAIDNAAWLQERGDPAFRIDGVPVYWLADLAAELGTEFDGSERAGSQAFAHLFAAMSGILGAIDIDMDLQKLMSLTDLLGGDHTTPELIGILLDWLQSLLDDPAFPNTFRIDPDRLTDVAVARIDLGIGGTDVIATLTAIQGETDDQTDDVLAYADTNGSGAWDPGEPWVIPGAGEVSEETMAATYDVAMFASELGAALLDRTEADVRPGVPDPFDLASLNHLLSALGYPPIIPEGVVQIDLAARFEALGPDSIRDFLQSLIDLLRGFLPGAATEEAA